MGGLLGVWKHLAPLMLFDEAKVLFLALLQREQDCYMLTQKQFLCSTGGR